MSLNVTKVSFLFVLLLTTVSCTKVTITATTAESTVTITDAATDTPLTKALECYVSPYLSTCDVSFTITPQTGKYLIFTTNCYSASNGSGSKAGDVWTDGDANTWRVFGSSSCTITFSYATPTTSCTTYPCIYPIEGYHGALKGLSGADQICKNLGPSGLSTYKAFLGGDSRRPCTNEECTNAVNWVLNPSTTYYRPDGTTIGTTTERGRLPDPLTNALYSEEGDFWLGLNGLWNPALHCGNWTSTVPGNSGGSSGNANAGDGTSLVAETITSDGLHKSPGYLFAERLYPNCMQTRKLLCIASAGGTKKVFVTTSTHTGNLGGTSGADEKCMADASYPGSGTYKAMVATSTRRACTSANCTDSSQNLDWVMTPSTTYTRINGTEIGVTNGAGIIVSPLTNAFQAAAGSAWTGLLADWTSGANNCSTWANAGTHPNYGALLDLTSTTLSTTAGGHTCDSTEHLICVEQ